MRVKKLSKNNSSTDSSGSHTHVDQDGEESATSKQQNNKNAPPSTQIHNVRFYNLKPRGIRNLAYNKIWSKLALSRDDNSIEIWDMQYMPCLEKYIPSQQRSEDGAHTVEGLAWAAGRLFSVYSSNQIVEWNLDTLRPKCVQYVTGNSILCLDISTAGGNDLACGTAEGYINLYDISDEEMLYKRVFEKQEGRVLCLKFDSTGEYLVSGSSGAIRIWDVSSGHALHRIAMGRMSRNREVTVWCLAVLKDFTIVAGDSRGHITVWDGRTAAQLESHQVLKADILSLALNEEETFLMCAGVEPIIRIYAKTKIKREDMVFNRWVKFLQRSVHDHDVLALISGGGDRIISGGVDGYLGISSISKQCSTISKYGPFLKNPVVTAATKERLVCLRYLNYLEVWKLGSTTGKNIIAPNSSSAAESDNKASSKSAKNPKLLALQEAPRKLMELKSKDGETIVCSMISPDGQWLCYATLNDIRLFRFHLTTKKEAPNPSATILAGEEQDAKVKSENLPKLLRLRDLPQEFVPASHLQFTGDSKRLLTVNPQTKEVYIFDLEASVIKTVSEDDVQPVGEVEFLECIETAKHVRDTIVMFLVSECGKFMAVAGADRTIAVWRIFKGKHFQHHVNLPRYVAATTALALDGKHDRLVAAYSDGKIIEYDLENMCFTCTSDQQVNLATLNHTHCITNICVDGRNPDIFVMQNDCKLIVMEKGLAQGDDDDSESVTRKRTRRSSSKEEAENKLRHLRLKYEKHFQHCIYLSWLSQNELILVGVNPLKLIEQLPSAFKQKKFGLE